MKPWFAKWKRCRMSKGDSKTQIVHAWIFIRRNILHLCFSTALGLISRHYPSTWGIRVFAFENVRKQIQLYDVHNGMRSRIFIFFLALFPSLYAWCLLLLQVWMCTEVSFLLCFFSFFKFNTMMRSHILLRVCSASPWLLWIIIILCLFCCYLLFVLYYVAAHCACVFLYSVLYLAEHFAVRALAAICLYWTLSGCCLWGRTVNG